MTEKDGGKLYLSSTEDVCPKMLHHQSDQIELDYVFIFANYTSEILPNSIHILTNVSSQFSQILNMNSKYAMEFKKIPKWRNFTRSGDTAHYLERH